MDVARLVLAFLQTLLSWPVITLALCLYALVKYEEPISRLIDRIRRWSMVDFAAPEKQLEATDSIKRNEKLLAEPEAATDAGAVVVIRPGTTATPGRTAESAQPQTPHTEAQRYVSEHPREALEEYARAFNSYRFERAYNLIYGTQLELLEFLESLGTTGAPYVDLNRFCRNPGRVRNEVRGSQRRWISQAHRRPDQRGDSRAKNTPLLAPHPAAR